MSKILAKISVHNVNTIEQPVPNVYTIFTHVHNVNTIVKIVHQQVTAVADLWDPLSFLTLNISFWYLLCFPVKFQRI